MPPAISDDELESDSDSVDMIPSKPVKKNSKKAAQAEEEDEESAGAAASDAENQDSDEDGEEFAVEKITEHVFEKNKLLYHVKWLGYEDPKDMTWEPLDNLMGAKDVIEEYHKTIGGPPTKGQRGKRKAADATASPAPAPAARGRPAKKAKANGAWQAPNGSWEKEVQSIETIGEDNSVNGESGLYVFIIFKDGHKTRFPMDMVRSKCPQKLLDYYEQHLVFKEGAKVDEGED